jgi:hypothetical protein
MLNNSLITVWLGAFAITATIAGCGGSELGAEVSGRVTLDGNPVGPGVVVFAPTDGNSNPPEGAILPDGSYFLKTSREVGLRPGAYKVAVSVYDVPDLKPGERSTAPPKLVTPEKYASHETSGLQFDVGSGDNAIDIKLVSK